MADVKAIRDKIVTKLRAVTGINVLDIMPTNPVLPAALVSPSTGVFLTEVTGDGCEDLDMTILVLVSRTVEENAQNRLDEYLSEGSSNLANAVESGAVTEWDYAIAGAARGYGQYVFGSGDQAESYLGFEIPVTVGVS